MKITQWPLLIALALASLLATSVRAAENPIQIKDIGAKLEFPDRITFSAHIASDAQIERVTLEYGTEKQTCGTVVAKAFPELKPGNIADVSWIWEMRQSGSEPPGTKLWYRWRVTDKAGWVDSDYLGIDQGPIVAMIENHKSGLIWGRMRDSPAVRTGLQRAGFAGGWLG